MYSRNISHYKKAKEYYMEQPEKRQIQYSHYKGPVQEYYQSSPVVENFSNSPTSKLESNYQVTKSGNLEKSINMQHETKTFPNTSDPSVWGPSFWFTLHNGAAHYPIDASNHRKKRMKDFILGIPVILPCKGCIPHAIAYIEEAKPRLDDIVSGQDNLFKFFVDFHNNVNERYGKKQFTYDEAYKIYKQGANITKMSYS